MFVSLQAEGYQPPVQIYGALSDCHAASCDPIGVWFCINVRCSLVATFPSAARPRQPAPPLPPFVPLMLAPPLLPSAEIRFGQRHLASQS